MCYVRKIFLLFLLLLGMDLVFGMNNNSSEQIWEDWGKHFGCKEDYLVLNYQNRNPVRGACLPRGYAENVAPNSDGATWIGVWYRKLQFLDLQEDEKTFTIGVKSSYHWPDKRIIGNIEQTKKVINFVLTAELPAVWKPLPKIRDLKTMKPSTGPSEFTTLYLLVDKNEYLNHTVLSIGMEYRAIVYCPLEFQTFPFDVQKCRFIDVNRSKDRASYLIGNRILIGKRRFDKLPTSPKFIAHGFEVTFEFKNFTYGTGFEIVLKRLVKPHLLQYYLPCFAIVCMAFVSFIVPISAIPGRVALIVTQFLTLTNMFIHHMVNKSKPSIKIRYHRFISRYDGHNNQNIVQF